MDPFEEFEFKPLTEGLGFHKKAEKLKADIKVANLGDEKVGRVIPEMPPAEILSARSMVSTSSKSKGLLTDDIDDGDLNPIQRPASKSISDLIAALPPSLDFLEDGVKTESLQTDGQSTGLNYPFLTRRKKNNQEQKPLTSAGTPLALQTSKTEKADDIARPTIFQPLGREDYSASVTEKAPLRPQAAATAAPQVTTSPTMPTPGRPAANLPPPPTFKAPPTKPVTPAAKNTKLEESYARAFPHTDKSKIKKDDKRPAATTATAAPSLKKASAALIPAIVDGMAVLGVSTIFLVVIIMITQIDIVRMMTHAKTNSSTHFHLLMLFLCVMQLYMLSARSFFGATLGEWAFELQLGTEEDQRQTMYPLKVIWRMVLILATGVITLPLLSKLFGRDLLALLGGPQLYRRPE